METPTDMARLGDYPPRAIPVILLKAVLDDPFQCTLIRAFHAVIKCFIDISIRVGEFHPHLHRVQQQIGHAVHRVGDPLVVGDELADGREAGIAKAAVGEELFAHLVFVLFCHLPFVTGL